MITGMWAGDCFDAPSLSQLRPRGTRDVRRSPKFPGAMTVFKKPAVRTPEVVPPFDGLHAPEHRVQILQGTIAVGTAQGGRWNLRVLRHRCRSQRAWSASLAGRGGILTHAGDRSNPLAASPTRNPVQLAVALSFFQASRCPSEVTPMTKVSPPVTFPKCLVHASRTAEGLLDFIVYCLATIEFAFARGRVR